MEKRRRISSLYRLLVIIALSAGIILNLYKAISVTSIMSYYTLQVNCMCLVAFVMFFIAEVTQKKYMNELYFAIKGTLLVSVLIMMIVYQISLLPNNFQMDADALKKSIETNLMADLMVHTVSPILVIVDYILFDQKGNFKIFYPLIWIFIPSSYVFYVYTYSANGGRFYNVGGSKKFAYFFLDYNKIGYNGVLEWLIAMAIFIILLGYIIIAIDKVLAWVVRKKKKN